MYIISYDEYINKVHGGWFGKCLGGAAGAPVEGFKRINEVDDFREIMNPDLPNDDLDLQLLWLEVLQKKGLSITGRDLADAWNQQCWYPMMEYGLFLKNYERGIYPPYSGEFNNPVFREGNGCPIRSEIWGLIFPGNPVLAARYAGMDGLLDHCGNSVWIEQFFSAVESMAFFESDVVKLIKAGLGYLPSDSKAARCIREMLDCCGKDDRDWLKARTQALRLFGHNDFTNSTINLAFVLIGLLFGKGNLEDTINITLKCGYDADCTCATAASVLGIVIGYKGIDPELKKLVKDKFILGIDVKRENNSIEYLSGETCEIGIEAAGSINMECEIAEVPEEVKIKQRKKEAPKVTISVECKECPAIGYDDNCIFYAAAMNNSNEVFEGELFFKDIPHGWKLLYDKLNVMLAPGESIKVENAVKTPVSVKEIPNTNILRAELVDGNGNFVSGCSFGIAGASVWKLAGPYIEALEKEDDPGLPSAHPEGCILPTLECMVNNAAYLDREYIDEGSISESIKKEDYIILNAYEDLLPVEQALTYSGQGCVYLMQELVSPEGREVWFVIGNSDGYRLWVNDELVQERDEIRLWTPYNNAGLLKLKKGGNTIALKLLRRNGSLKFSFALRKNNGEHWHKNRWYVDFASKIRT